MNGYWKTKDTRRKGMTHKDAIVLVRAIRSSECYKFVVNEMKDIETKVKHGMILYKNESDKLENIYRRVMTMEEVMA